MPKLQRPDFVREHEKAPLAASEWRIQCLLSMLITYGVHGHTVGQKRRRAAVRVTTCRVSTTQWSAPCQHHTPQHTQQFTLQAKGDPLTTWLRTFYPTTKQYFDTACFAGQSWGGSLGVFWINKPQRMFGPGQLCNPTQSVYEVLDHTLPWEGCGLWHEDFPSQTRGHSWSLHCQRCYTSATTSLSSYHVLRQFFCDL